MAETKENPKEPQAESAPVYRRLYRSCDDRVIGGVAGGLAEYFEIDPTLMRLLVLLLVFTGAGLFFYIVAWIIIPEDPNCTVRAHVQTEDLHQRAEQVAGEIRQTVERATAGRPQQRDGRRVGGLILVGLGLLFLLQTWFSFDMGRLWPVILIVIGLAIIMGRGGRK